jgi:hypothetical protein
MMKNVEIISHPKMSEPAFNMFFNEFKNKYGLELKRSRLALNLR